MKRDVKPFVLPQRMDAEERRLFVLAYANGTVWTHHDALRTSRNIAFHFLPVAFGVFEGATEEDMKKLGLIWADTTRDRTTGRGCNGVPIFASCRLMLTEDWDELRPKVEEEIARREALKT